MKLVYLFTMLALSGCATTSDFGANFMAGLAKGARASAGALSPDVYQEQQLQRRLANSPNARISETNCQTMKNGDVRCVTIDQ